MGNGDGTLLVPAMIGLALIAAAYSLYGGLSAVAWTDVIQVILLSAWGNYYNSYCIRLCNSRRWYICWIKSHL